MGQKVHPLGFRVGLNGNYKSKWFVKPKEYSLLLFQDYLIRKNILNYFNILNNSKNKKNILDSINITDIKINRKFDQVYIDIYVASMNKVIFNTSGSNYDPLIKIQSNKIVDQLQRVLLKQVSSFNLGNKKIINSSKIIVNIVESPDINTNAVFIAKCLIDDLENRAPFRRALKTILDTTQKQNNLAGVKIQISGRLNGIEMARSEWVREGRIPLQTLTANIGYYNDVAETKYGLLGVKVWVYKNKS